jgi:hypothetical protein
MIFQNRTNSVLERPRIIAEYAGKNFSDKTPLQETPMRKTISGLIAAAAVLMVSAAPAVACGYGSCCGAAYVEPCAAPHVYVVPGCHFGCGWGYERLADPELQYHSHHQLHQYYYVNQGPTYTGPGNFAPYPMYREGGVGYHPRPYYGRRVLHSYY